MKNEKIKILFVLEAYTGGTRTHIIQILNALDKDRFNIYFAVSPSRRHPEFETDMQLFKQSGINIIIINMRRNIFAISNIIAIYRLTSLIKKEKFHIIHTHSSIAGAIGRFSSIPLPLLSPSPTKEKTNKTTTKVNKKKQYLYLFHTPHVFPFEMDCSAIKKNLYLAIERFLSKYTSLFITLSAHQRDIAISKLNISSEKITVIPNGIDLQKFNRHISKEQLEELRKKYGLSSNEFIIGFIGRLEEQKGPFVLLKALKTLYSPDNENILDTQNIKTLIIGSGSLERKIKSYINTNNLNDKIIMTGYQPDILPFYKIIDILIIPSLWESFPYTLLEAMAAGVPAIASQIGGIPEIIIDNNGILFPRGDYNSLCEKIRELAKSPGKRKEISQNAENYVQEHFNMDKCIHRLTKLYLNAGNLS